VSPTAPHDDADPELEHLLALYTQPRPEGRLQVELCMVASLDGTISVGGRSGPLGDPADHAVLGALRRHAGLILVGAGTIRAEAYGPVDEGVTMAIVTRTGNLDPTAPVFRDGRAWAIAPASATIPDGIAVLRCGDDDVDIVDAVSRLHEIAPQARFIHAEGGAVLNGELIAADLVDVVNLTLSGHTAAGPGPRVAMNATEVLHRFTPEHSVTRNSMLFTRWRRHRD
jgi:riboflavin biosynthesis pyrimidine reductase